MGLKCRLLGHAYGDSEVERNREEQGDEVVVTIREVQVCERCGAEQIVSQNKEVTAIRSPAEVGLDDASPTGGDVPSGDGRAPPTEATDDPKGQSAGATASSSGDAGPDANAPDSGVAGGTGAEASGGATEREPTEGPPAGSPDTADQEQPAEPIEEVESDGWETGSDDWDDVEADPDGEDAVILDDAETERDETQWPEETDTDPTGAAERSAAVDDDVSASDDEPAIDDEPAVDDRPAGEEEEVTNDAEIIDGEDAEETPRERGHGEWPEREDDPDAGGWPDHEGEDEGYDATAEEAADVELGGNGLTPEVNGHRDPEVGDDRSVQGVAVEPEDATDAQQRGAANASDGRPEEGFIRAGESATLESDVPDDHIEFYCPNCGHARIAGASSMRAGDICPECKQGYIAERER